MLWCGVLARRVSIGEVTAVTTTKRFAEREREKMASDDAIYVQSDEFLSLLVSRRDLVRSDSFGGEVRGLLDRKTGKRILIEQTKLFTR
jgi:hypothetical protein